MKTTPKERYPVKSTLVAIGVGLLTVLLMFCLAALVISAADLSPTAIPAVSAVILLIGALLAGLLSAKSAGERGMLMGAVAGVGMFIPLLLIGLIGGEVTAAAFVRFAAVTAGASVGGVIGVNRHKRVRH